MCFHSPPEGIVRRKKGKTRKEHTFVQGMWTVLKREGDSNSGDVSLMTKNDAHVAQKKPTEEKNRRRLGWELLQAIRREEGNTQRDEISSSCSRAFIPKSHAFGVFRGQKAREKTAPLKDAALVGQSNIKRGKESETKCS